MLPTTCVGNSIPADVPLPSCPEEFSPQQNAVESAITAHAWCVPLATANAESGRAIGLGSADQVSVDDQQYTPPDVDMPQL